MSEDGQQASGASQDGVLKDPLSVRNTDTGSMKRMAAEGAAANQARKTIKLKPLAAKKGGVAPSDLTASMPAAPAETPTPGVEDQATIAMDRTAIDQQTQKLSKPHVPVATIASGSHSSVSASPAGLPGSKQTIKLRPSTGADATVMDQKPASAQTIKLTPKSATSEAPAAAGPTETVHTVAMAKQTIRLVPKKAEVRSSPPVQPKPSDPTINLQAGSEAAQPVRPSDPTSKFSPTQMMSQAEASAEGGIEETAEVKTKIGIKHQGPSPTMPSAAAVQEELEAAELADVPKKDEPSIIFTVAAALAFLSIGFLSFVLFAQFDNHWWNGNISVPGLHSK